MDIGTPGHHEVAVGGPALAYRLCPRCLREVALPSAERHCVNGGTRLLEGRPHGTGLSQP